MAGSLEATGPLGVVYTIGAVQAFTLGKAPRYSMAPDGTRVIYRTNANELFVAPTESAGPVRLATGVLGLDAVGSDGGTVLFHRKVPDPSTGTVDVNMVSTRAGGPSELLLAAAGSPVGFTGDARTALYIETSNGASSLRAAAVVGGPSRELMRNAVGGRPLPVGTGVLAFSNVKIGAGISPKVAQVDYVDAAGPTGSATLATEIPFDQTSTALFVSGKRVAFTSVTPDEEGIYAVTLP